VFKGVWGVRYEVFIEIFFWILIDWYGFTRYNLYKLLVHDEGTASKQKDR
jgi:hypothetical protein